MGTLNQRRGVVLCFVVFVFLISLPAFSAEQDGAVGLAIGKFSAGEGLDSFEAERVFKEFRQGLLKYGANQFIVIDSHPAVTPGRFEEEDLREIDEWKEIGQAAVGEMVLAPRGRVYIQVRFIDVDSLDPVKTKTVVSLGREEPYIRYAVEILVKEICGIENTGRSLAYQYEAAKPPDESAFAERPAPSSVDTGRFEEGLAELNELVCLQPPDRQIFLTALEVIDDAREQVQTYAENPKYGGIEAQLYLADLRDFIDRSEDVVRKNFFNWERAEAVTIITGQRDVYDEILRQMGPEEAAARRFRWGRVLVFLEEYRFFDRLLEDPVVRDVYGDVFGLFIADDWKASKKGYLIVRIRGAGPAGTEPAGGAHEVTVTELAGGGVYRKVLSEGNWEIVFENGLQGEIDLLVEADGEKHEVSVGPGRIEEVVFRFTAGSPDPGGKGFWHALRTPPWKEGGNPYGYFLDQGMTDIIRGFGDQPRRLFLLDVYGGPAVYPSFQGAAGVRIGINMIMKNRILPAVEIDGPRFLKSLLPALAFGGGAFSLFYFTGNEAAALPLGLMVSSYTLTGLLSSDSLTHVPGYIGGIIGAGLLGGLGAAAGYLAGRPVPTVTGTILGLYGGTAFAGISSTLFNVNDKTAALIFLISGGVAGLAGGLVGGLTDWNFLEGLSGGFISLIPASLAGITAGVLGGSTLDFSYKVHTFHPYGPVALKPSHQLRLDVLNLGWGVSGFPVNFFVQYVMETNGGFSYQGTEYLPEDEASNWDYYPVAGVTIKGLEPLVFQGTVSGFKGGLGSRDLSASGTTAFVTKYVDLGYTFSYISSRRETGAEPAGVYRSSAGEALTPSTLSFDHQVHLNVRPLEWFTVYARAGFERLEYALYEVAGGVTAGVVEELRPVVIDAELGIRIQVHNIFSRTPSMR
jgi:hypothetical protein